MGERGRNCFLRFPAASSVFCSFLLLQTTCLADQGPNLPNSARIFDKLPFLRFIGSVPTTPDPNTSEKVARYKWEAYRDTNWWCM